MSPRVLGLRIEVRSGIGSVLARQLRGSFILSDGELRTSSTTGKLNVGRLLARFEGVEHGGAVCA